MMMIMANAAKKGIKKGEEVHVLQDDLFCGERPLIASTDPRSLMLHTKHDADVWKRKGSVDTRQRSEHLHLVLLSRED